MKRKPKNVLSMEEIEALHQKELDKEMLANIKAKKESEEGEPHAA